MVGFKELLFYNELRATLLEVFTINVSKSSGSYLANNATKIQRELIK